MNKKLPDILFVASTDWGGLWFQRQEFAQRFALKGHRVFYLNRTLQRWPKFHHFRRRFVDPIMNKTLSNPRPENLQVITPIWMPPINCLRFLNRKLIRRTFAPLDIQSPVLITDVPTYNALDAIDFICPLKIIYLNVHNYNDCDWILPEILESEKLLVQKADVLFGDSTFHVERLKRISNGRKVFQSPPGVNYSKSRGAFRGDEAQRRKSICFFGNIQSSIHLDLFGKMSARYKVIFIGQVSDEIRNHIPKKIEIRPPVCLDELAYELKEMEILGLFYVKNQYNRGVIPAKLFECVATRKPVLVCGLTEMKHYPDIIYNFDGSEEEAIQIIEHLPETETSSRLAKRDEIARDADWSNRFKNFSDTIFSNGE